MKLIKNQQRKENMSRVSENVMESVNGFGVKNHLNKAKVYKSTTTPKKTKGTNTRLTDFFSNEEKHQHLNTSVCKQVNMSNVGLRKSSLSQNFRWYTRNETLSFPEKVQMWKCECCTCFSFIQMKSVNILEQDMHVKSNKKEHLSC